MGPVFAVKFPIVHKNRKTKTQETFRIIRLLYIGVFISSANAVGDKCIDDFDGDGVKDDDDPCPNVRHIGKTGFLDHFVVDLYPSHGDPDPNWHVGKKVYQNMCLYKPFDPPFFGISVV